MRNLFCSLFLVFLSLGGLANDSWKKILNEKKGTVTVYYYPHDDASESSRDIVDKFEEELIISFTSFLEKKYAVDLETEWNNEGDFNKIFDKIENGSHGEFGLSTISITKKRTERFNFSRPYLADIQVLVTNEKFKLANTPEQLGELLHNKRAVSIRNTTLEQGLTNLKSELQIDYGINYVNNADELIDAIAKDPASFGYVDLIHFLVSFNKLNNLKRQLFFPVRLKGIGMIYPIDSDWDPVVQDYFNSEQFRFDQQRISQKYFGMEIGSVISQITWSSEFGLYEEIMISNREKEVQYQELLNTIEREKKQYRFKNTLLVALGIVGLAVTILLISYRLKAQTNKVLLKQQELIEKNNLELKKLNAEKNELINILAHDLRSPLTKIQGCALMMLEEKKLSNESGKLTDIIVDASNQIKNMITKILDVEAIESGNHNLQLEMMSPAQLVKEIIQQHQDRADKKSIEVAFDDEDEDMKIIADRFYLAQVLQNLLLNAIKFSEPGSKVMLGVVKQDSMVRIIIKDQGPGFTKEDKKHVFRKFAQLSAKPTNGEETTGLGLSIVKKYTEIMDGTVSFESEEGKGTEFYVDFKDAQSASMASRISITSP